MTKFLKLKDITKKIGAGSTPTGGNSVYCEQGIALIRSQNVLDMRFSYNGLAFIDDQQAEKLKGVTVKQNDVLLNITGDSIARSCVVPENILPARVNQHVAIIRCKDSESADYVNYYLQYLKKYLLQICRVGGTRNALTKEVIENLNIYLHEDHQKRANLLSTLDAKIELNNRINSELEAMAKTLYDYWFVQFDFPDVNGKPYRSSAGKMVYNDMLKREIPEGWDIKTVSDLIEVRDGTHDSPKKSESGQYLITSKHLKKSGLDFQEAYLISDEDFEAVNKRSQVHEGDFLISMIGTVGLTHWVMKISTPFAIKNIGLFKTSQSPRLADYIYSAVNSSFGKTYLEQHLSTGTSQPYVTLGTLRQIPIVMPKENVLNLFIDCVKPIHQKIYLKTTESQQLTQLRDWLLPMLMNGQVRVN